MTPVWEIHVAPQIEKQIEGLRTHLESPGMPPEKTEFYRGQIFALRQMLKLPETLKKTQGA